MSDLTDIDNAIQDSFSTNDESNLESEELETQDEGKEGGKKTQKGKKEEEPESKDGVIEGYDDTDAANKPAEGDEKDEKTDDEVNIDDELEQPEKKKKRNRYQERIDTLTRDKYESQARIAELEEQINSKPPELPPEPNPADYTFDKNKQGDLERARDQFNQDVGAWRAEVERIKTAHENRGTAKVEQEKEKYHTKMSKETSVYGDYATANQTLTNVPLTHEIHNALVHDENNTDLFCFLGNPKNARHLETVLKAKGYRQSQLLAEISFKLQYHKNNAKRKPSNNPPPGGKPKGGESGSGKSRNLDNASFETVSKALAEAEKRQRNQFVV